MIERVFSVIGINGTNQKFTCSKGYLGSTVGRYGQTGGNSVQLGKANIQSPTIRCNHKGPLNLS